MDDSTSGLISFLGLGLVVLAAVLGAFELLRRITPATYYYREHASQLQQRNDYDDKPLHALQRPEGAFLPWIKPTLLYTEEDLVQTHGLDAALYVRFLRVITQFFAVLALLLSPILMPVYGTGVLRNATGPDRVEGIAIISLANVPQQDNFRLSMAVLSEILIILAVSYLLRRELAHFLKLRLEYRANSERNPGNYAVVVLDIPSKERSKDKIAEFFERAFPGDVAGVHHVRNASKIGKAKSKLIKSMKARECADYRLWKARSKKPDSDLSKLDKKCQALFEKQENARQELDELMSDVENNAPHTHAAIVMFKSKRSATIAAGTPLWHKETEWRVERAAEPKAVAWDKLGIHRYVALFSSIVVTVSLTAFCIFWFLPVTFLQGLANIEAMSKFQIFSFLDVWVKSKNETAQRILTFVQGVLPQIVLTVCLLLVPIIIRLAVGFERIPHRGRFESKVRTMVCVFFVMSNFLYVVLAGAVLEKIKDIIATRTLQTIIDILGTTVPAQATFLMGYILFNGFVSGPVALLNLGRLLMRPVLLRLGTPTERKQIIADANGVEFPYFERYATVQMIAFIAIIYANIAPLIMSVAAVYCGIAYVTNKFLVMYSMVPSFESGGQLYSGAWYTILTALYIHQLSLIGVFALKKSPAHSTLMLIVFFASLSLAVYFHKSFSRITQLGSLVDQMESVNKNPAPDIVPPHFINKYVNPDLRPLASWEIEDLTGIPPEEQAQQKNIETDDLVPQT